MVVAHRDAGKQGVGCGPLTDSRDYPVLLMLTQKFSNFGRLAAVAELSALIKNSDGSEVYRAGWPALRSTLLSDVVPARLKAIEKQLEAGKQGLVLEIEALVDTIRRSTRMVNPRPGTSEKQQKLIREYLYLKHSNDVLGRGIGISSSAMARQFDWTTQDCYLDIEVKCARCGNVAQGHVTTLAMDLKKDGWSGFEVQCGSCGHTGRTGQHGRNSLLKGDICRCPGCLQKYQESADAVRRHANRILDKIGVELQQMCRTEVARALTPPSIRELSAEGRAFAARMYEQPSTDLFDAMEDLVSGGLSRKHPVDTHNAVHEMAYRFRAEGLLDVTASCPNLSNSEDLLHETLTIPWYGDAQRRRKEQEKKEHLYAVVRGGADDIESFLTWRKAVEALGLVHAHHFCLPIDFTWTLLDRAQAQNRKAECETLYAYAYLTQFHQGIPGRLSLLRNVVALGDSLFSTHRDELMQQLRRVGSPGMVAELRKELARDWPDADGAVDSIRDAIRHKALKKLGERYRYTDAMEPLASLFYFEMSREAIGQETGVPLKDISLQFGHQSSQFRKNIRAAHMPFPCPCCKNEGLAYGLRLDSTGLTSGSFSCPHCGHQAQLGGANAITCQCQVCSANRNACLTAVAASADTIVESVMAGLEEATATVARREISWNRTGFGYPIWKAYAALRHSGRTPLEALGTLVGGTAITEPRVWLHEDVGLTPPVLIDGVVDGVFVPGATEVPAAEVRRKFLQARLVDWMNQRLAEDDETLRFDDLASVIQTLKKGQASEVVAVAQTIAGKARYRAFVVPVRWALAENREMVRRLAEAAERDSVVPQHILAGDTRNFDRTRHGKPLAPLMFQEWPTNRDSAQTEKQRERQSSRPKAPGTEAAKAEAAVQLLKSLGYLVVPPSGQKNLG